MIDIKKQILDLIKEKISSLNDYLREFEGSKNSALFNQYLGAHDELRHLKDEIESL